MRLSEVGERAILDYLIPRLSFAGGHLRPGDDGVDYLPRGRVVVTGDMLVGSTDVPPGAPMESVGWKAVTASLSDLAATGARPVLVFVEMGLPPEMELDELKRIWSGIEMARDRYSVMVAGGDTNSCRDLVLGVFALGEAERPVPRGGSRPGDLIGVTGTFGRAAAGLHSILTRDLDHSWEALRRSFLWPVARIEAGAVASRYATAMIDSSDGLARSLYDMSRNSGLGYLIERLPVDDEVTRYALAHGLDPERLVLGGGEEYELIITFDPSNERQLREELASVGCELIVIGRVVEGRGVWRVQDGAVVQVPELGWSHFGR
ncbi:MAG: thiamine-phosphate kinase [Aigarchaeota archaeon]|nr:thiamine-phosphate kinase [Candidatus Calditenuis fumarioli]